MATHIGLLRAVNVGGRKAVAMADLRALLAGLGLSEPRTLLQSGNVVFGSPSRPAALEALLEAEVKRRLGLATTVFVRSAREWTAVIEDNPFRAEARRDPGHLLVMSLKDAPAATAIKALQAAISGREVVRAQGRHAYIVYPDRIGESRLTTALIERTLGTAATGRNWNTVLKLAALASA
jgi:uncharacterized protein (DUF1697 family)